MPNGGAVSRERVAATSQARKQTSRLTVWLHSRWPARLAPTIAKSRYTCHPRWRHTPSALRRAFGQGSTACPGILRLEDIIAVLAGPLRQLQLAAAAIRTACLRGVTRRAAGERPIAMPLSIGGAIPQMASDSEAILRELALH